MIRSVYFPHTSVIGPVLLTHFGISGPATFSYSSQIPYTDISSHKPHHIHIIPFADHNDQYWLSWLNEKAASEPKKQLSTILHYHFTKRRVDAFLNAHKIDGETMISNLSRDIRKHLAQLLGR
jgi:predicted flavoprotein YhiN